MRFAYMRYTVEATTEFPEGILYRPMAPVRVTGPSGDFSFLALLDTGADETLLPRSVADEVGIEPDESQTSTVGAFGGQTMSTVRGQVEFELRGSGQQYRWAAPVGFVAFSDPRSEIAILGHIGCLEFFRAAFDGETKEVELLPTSQFPGTISGDEPDVETVE